MAPLLLLALPCAAASLRAQILAAELKREAPYLARPDGMRAALRPPADEDAVGVAVVVDPLCDYLGVALIEELLERGVAVATIFSDYMAEGLAAANGVEPPRELLAPRTDGEEWLSGAAPPLACLSESDAGIATAEQLSNLLGCEFRNAVSPSRRHKWLLHETLREHNLPHCRQALCATEAELVTFYRAESSAGRNTIIVKPCRGVGSEDVYKCCDEEACANAFSMLKATTRYAGGSNDVILAQQFLEGPEYAIDSVSRNGEHKVTAVWRYDKVVSYNVQDWSSTAPAAHQLCSKRWTRPATRTGPRTRSSLLLTTCRRSSRSTRGSTTRTCGPSSTAASRARTPSH